MNRRQAVVLVVLLAPAGIAFASPPLNVKPGLWEMTIERQSSGALPIPQAVLDRLPPERRALIEERLRQRESQGPKREVFRRCVTQAELEHPPFGDDDNQGRCQHALLKSSGTHMEGTFECSGEYGTQSGSLSYEAPDPEHTSGTLIIKAVSGAREMTINARVTAHWLGADCAGVKPGERSRVGP